MPKAKPSTSRVPPYSEEAERGVLGSILINPAESIDKVLEDKITDKHFYIPAHAKIYVAIGELYSKGNVVDILTVADKLDADGILEKIGGSSMLDRLADDSIPSHIGGYIDILKKKMLARKIITISQEAMDRAYQSDDPEELRSKAESAFIRLESNIAPVTLHDGFERIIGDLIRIDGGGDPRPLGPSTGYKGLDRALGGGMTPGVHWITGEPGTGKTSLVCNIILNEIMADISVAFLTLEMPVDDMLQKLISIHCEDNIRTALVGMKLGDIVGAQSARDLIEGKGLFDIAGQDQIQTDQQFKSWCRRKVLKDGAKIIVLDYMQLLRLESEKQMSQEQEVSSLTGTCKEIGATLNVPLLCICEENEGGNIRYSRRGDFAGASHWRLKRSGDLEPQAPDYIQTFDVFTKKARFGVPFSTTAMELVGTTGRIHECSDEDEYDYDKGTAELPELTDGYSQADFPD